MSGPARPRLRVETTRRLTTLTGDRPPAVFDVRVVDDLGRVWSSCDHGHPTQGDAETCGVEQRARF